MRDGQERQDGALQRAAFADARGDGVTRRRTDDVRDPEEQREPQVVRLGEAQDVVRVEVDAALQEHAREAGGEHVDQNARLEWEVHLCRLRGGAEDGGARLGK